MDVEVSKKKTIVLKPAVSKDEIEETVEKKKTDAFGTIFTRPKQEEITISSLDLYYEPYWLVSGTYSVDYFRTNIYEINTEDTVKEVKIADQVFPVKLESGTWGKIKRGMTGGEKNNKLEIPVEEHVIFDVEDETTLNGHGTEAKFDYTIETRTIESYPERILEDNKDKVRSSKINQNEIIDKLVNMLQEDVDKDVKMIKEKVVIDKLSEIFIPIYEARCIDSKNKVKILRIDAVKRKVIS
ncbi:MAG: hypothetical protein GWN01_12865 [Nitrosopumilaceae archaeon]|nr:hypothetical protein [Nitrosopumilaceae archaeon]NIU01755.1 hypothetical protein [Nitrosopumilaceae archaeon]NIU88155.1 hypothetical protein [Nitrosopumilaceae archaeon]NIV66478.1 hypothetical protein [Nitrosopumilaceae archaeon]NIX62357.1 hypothetical protein [Nitrosopumilaceae archaeon]